MLVILRETVRIINGYMTNHKVSFELQSRVRKYLEYTMKNTNHMEEEKIILNKLNKSLKDELLIESMGKVIKEVAFFKDNFSEQFLEKLAFVLKKRQVSPEEFLYKVYKITVFSKLKNFLIQENTLDESSLFILKKGNIEEVITKKNNESYLPFRQFKVYLT